MRVLGRVRVVSKNKNLIVEASEKPRIGDKVYDEKMALVGYVYDIIGPVNSPFVVVKVDLDKWKPEALQGKILYWQGDFAKKKKRRRGGRKRR